ncbi:MAG: SAM-dependent methyltransferase [Anaerolineales bacterium]|nr:SAM-dependent methyltransferase [Anaerolineales bacterium]
MQDQLLEFLQAEADKPFYGWDFSYLDYRIANAPMDWSYPSLILSRLHGPKPPQSLLDMGTGGGEFFSRLRPFPPRTFATEGYEPNLPLARARLGPLGVEVLPFTDDNHLPFADGEFEMITNRHESYAPRELFRILAPGGRFYTQQVGEQNDKELVRMLEAPIAPNDTPWHLDYATQALQAAGFIIETAKECFPTTRIFDVGAIAYYFKAIPWEIPNFSVEQYYDPLARIHERIQREGYIDVKSHRFLIVVRKP